MSQILSLEAKNHWKSVLTVIGNGVQNFYSYPQNDGQLNILFYDGSLPERVKVVMVAATKEIDTLSRRIDVNKYSSYSKLLRVTASSWPCLQTRPY